MVLIVTGDDFETVKEGLRKCEEAFTTAQTSAPDSVKRIAEAYFKKHQFRAYERLLEFLLEAKAHSEE